MYLYIYIYVYMHKIGARGAGLGVELGDGLHRRGALAELLVGLARKGTEIVLYYSIIYHIIVYHSIA